MLLGATRGPDANPAVRNRLAEVEDVQWLPAEPMDAEDTGGSSRERSAPVTRTRTWLRCSGIERAETRSSLKNCREWPSPIGFSSLMAPFRPARRSRPRKASWTAFSNVRDCRVRSRG